MSGRPADEPFRFEGMALGEVQEALEAIAAWDPSLREITLSGDVEVAFTSGGDGHPAHADFPSSPRPGQRALRAIAELVAKAKPTGHVWDDVDGGGLARYPEGLTLVIPGLPRSASARAALEADPGRRQRAATVMAKLWGKE